MLPVAQLKVEVFAGFMIDISSCHCWCHRRFSPPSSAMPRPGTIPGFPPSGARWVISLLKYSPDLPCDSWIVAPRSTASLLHH
jgi:hypothetical protein